MPASYWPQTTIIGILRSLLPEKKELEKLTGGKALNLPFDIWVEWSGPDSPSKSYLAVVHHSDREPLVIIITVGTVLSEAEKIDPSLLSIPRCAQSVRSYIIRQVKEWK